MGPGEVCIGLNLCEETIPLLLRENRWFLEHQNKKDLLLFRAVCNDLIRCVGSCGATGDSEARIPRKRFQDRCDPAKRCRLRDGRQSTLSHDNHQFTAESSGTGRFRLCVPCFRTWAALQLQRTNHRVSFVWRERLVLSTNLSSRSSNIPGSETSLCSA